MKSKVLMFVMVFLVLFSGLAFSSHDKTSTGFYWPIGEDDSVFKQSCGTWLGRNSEYGGSNCYDFPTTDGKDKTYHNGVDMMTQAQAGEDAEVYAIADGIVDSISCNDKAWGPGNCVVFILHYTKEKGPFLGVYGHLIHSDHIEKGVKIKTGLKVKLGQFVKAGDLIGYTGWFAKNGNEHLHFGIVPSATRPGTLENNYGWGRVANRYWNTKDTATGQEHYTNGFVDLIKFIKENHPARFINAWHSVDYVLVTENEETIKNCDNVQAAYKIKKVAKDETLEKTNVSEACQDVKEVNEEMDKSITETDSSIMIEQKIEQVIEEREAKKFTWKFIKAWIWTKFGRGPGGGGAGGAGGAGASQTQTQLQFKMASHPNSVKGQVNSHSQVQKASESSGIFYIPVTVVLTDNGGYILDDQDPTIQGYNLYSANEQPKPDPLPNFFMDEVKLVKEEQPEVGINPKDYPEKEVYTFKYTDTVQTHTYSGNDGDANWGKGDDDKEAINVACYLSKGLKKDDDYYKRRVIQQEIKKGNIDIGEIKHEWQSVNLYDWYLKGFITPGNYYNFNCYVDRENDENNGDGEIKEN